MHLTKRLLSAAAVIVLAAACFLGSGYQPAEKPAKQPVKENSWFDRSETIYFWYSDDAMTNYVSSAAVTFGEEHGVHVIPVLVSESEYLEAVNKASLSGEQMPDAFLVGHDQLEKAYLAGLAGEIADETGLVTAAQFPKAALSAVTYQGQRVAYPLSFDTSVLVYNETYMREWAYQRARAELTEADVEVDEETGEPLEEAVPAEVSEEEIQALAEKIAMNFLPATVDDVLTIANTFDVPEGVEGVMKWDVSDIFYNYWIVGNYMNVGGEAGDNDAQIYVNNPEVISCLEVYTALNQFFYIEPDTVTYESVVQDFLDQKCVFTIATTDIVKRLAEAKAEGTIDFEYGACMMPDVSEELGSRSMSVTKTVAVNGYSEHKKLANEFAAYLAGDCAEDLYEMTDKASAKLSADSDNGMLQVFKLEYDKSIPLPKMMETSNYWLLLEGLFSKAWKGTDVTALVQELEILLQFQTQ